MVSIDLMSIYKYNEIDQIHDCPCPDAKPVARTAYRWVFADSRPENYLPLAKLETAATQRGGQPCKIWGLSFFDNADNARIRYRTLCKTSPLIKKKYGEFLARVQLTEDDGLATSPCSRTGHFTFFEYKHFELALGQVETL